MSKDDVRISTLKVSELRQVDPAKHMVAKSEPNLPKTAFRKPSRREKRQIDEAKVQVTDVLVTETVATMAQAAMANVADLTNVASGVVTTRRYARPHYVTDPVARAHMIEHNKLQGAVYDRYALAIMAAAGERFAHTVQQSSYEGRSDEDHGLFGLLASILGRR